MGASVSLTQRLETQSTPGNPIRGAGTVVLAAAGQLAGHVSDAGIDNASIRAPTQCHPHRCRCPGSAAHLHAVLGPAALLGRRRDVLLQAGLQLGKVKKQVACRPVADGNGSASKWEGGGEKQDGERKAKNQTVRKWRGGGKPLIEEMPIGLTNDIEIHDLTAKRVWCPGKDPVQGLSPPPGRGAEGPPRGVRCDASDTASAAHVKDPVLSRAYTIFATRAKEARVTNPERSAAGHRGSRAPPEHRRRPGELALRVDELRWVQQVAAAITLVAARILVLALWAAHGF
eukprot:361415-Chlamydomonas_euryale.AAC.6